MLPILYWQLILFCLSNYEQRGCIIALKCKCIGIFYHKLEMYHILYYFNCRIFKKKLFYTFYRTTMFYTNLTVLDCHIINNV